MNADRRARTPGRREEDALTREIVRALLKDEGYMTRSDIERNFVSRGEHHNRVVDRRADRVVHLAIASLFLSPVLSALAIHLIR